VLERFQTSKGIFTVAQSHSFFAINVEIVSHNCAV